MNRPYLNRPYLNRPYHTMNHLWLETATSSHLLLSNTASVSVHDRGINYGDGLFETIRIHHQAPLFLDRHLNRLATGLTLLNLSTPWAAATLTQRCHQLITTNHTTNGILRLTITRGPGPRGFDLPSDPRPTLIIQTIPSPPHSSPVTPHTAILAPWRVDPASPLCQLKSLSALDKVLAKQYAHQQQADDALLLNFKDHLTEATSANLFIVQANQILTPTLACGVLPGITRQLLLETAPTRGYRIIETELTLAMLTQANEAFLTNVSSGVRPLTAFNQHPIGSGQPGPITLALANHYAQLCQRLASNLQPPISNL